MMIGATLTGFFIMGIPQFFGKIDHYHILWYVLLILSVSPIGHCLSIDSWRNNIPQINGVKSSNYGVPIKIVMILIGLSYFFPGFWKFSISGFEWAFSENLKFKLYSKWLMLDGWTPFFRIDHYPFLYQSAAFMTLVIEIGFIFALFYKKIRPLFVIGALGFHVSVWYFMKNPFFSLMVLYVIFINWSKVFAFISNTLKNFNLSEVEVLNKPKSYLKYFIVGGFLIFGNVATGSLLIDSWPFGVYPTFASIESATVPSILIQAENENSEVVSESIPLLDANFKNEFNSVVRLRGYLGNLLNANTPEPQSYRALADIFYDSKNLNPDNYTLKFYKIRLSTNPDKSSKVNQKQELLYSL
ncbi:hypothetical protein [Gracilimonas sp.]|uniref:hypothetical protein n=1 Tax=Gracilimonas sp. TaxID=1974203 RepID=UPI0028714A76|nr:hypothetical protein [Gracilimonas sp.]